MKTPAIAVLWLLATVALAASAPARAVVVDASAAADFAALEAAQSEANAKSGPRAVAQRSISVPGTVSPELQALAAAPYRVPGWNANPKSADERKDPVAKPAARGAALQPGSRQKLGVMMQPAVIGGVKAFILTPRTIPPENRNRLP